MRLRTHLQEEVLRLALEIEQQQQGQQLVLLLVLSFVSGQLGTVLSQNLVFSAAVCHAPYEDIRPLGNSTHDLKSTSTDGLATFVQLGPLAQQRVQHENAVIVKRCQLYVVQLGTTFAAICMPMPLGLQLGPQYELGLRWPFSG